MELMSERENPPSEEGAAELVNLSQLAAALGVSRQWLHRLRVQDPDFPQPKRQPGSTRDFFDLAEGRQYYESRELHQGERTDLKPRPEPTEEGSDG
jgi:predicted DNA-binding transcriptional regulator AlpA